MQAYRLWITRPWKAKETFNVGNVGGTGTDLLDFVHGELEDMASAPITGDKKFTRFDGLEQQGRTIRFACSAGRYGEGGEIVDIMTGKTVGTLGDEHATLVSLRNLLVVPKHGTCALLLCERFAGRGVLSVVRARLESVFKERFDELRLNVQAVINEAAWAHMLENAELQAITAVRYRHSDKADAKTPKRVGVLRVQRTGYRGHSLDKQLLKDALEGKAAPHVLVGLNEPLPGAEVHITVKEGTQERTYAVGSLKPPAIAIVLAGDEAERPDDEDFYDTALERVPALLSQYDVDLPPDWQTG